MSARQSSARPLIVFRSSLLVVAALVSALPASAARHGLNGRIAFVSDRDGNSEIYVMNPDGSGQTRLTNNPAKDIDPAWSPDGRRIAFVSNRSGTLEIFVMKADGSNVTQLTDGGGNEDPAWSPDGRKIAFHSFRDSVGLLNAEIYTMSADGTNQTRLTNFDGQDYKPAWSRDGRAIAFVSTGRLGDDTRNIFIMNADGSNIRALTEGVRGPFDSEPSFSPRGDKILFTRGPAISVKERVMVMNSDGSNQTRLALGTFSPGTFQDFTNPVFSPDGTKIAFAADNALNVDSRIRLMEPDGGNEVEITHNANVSDTNPSWQPVFSAETTGVYVPSTGQWLLRNSNTAGNPNITLTFGGQPGDLPVAGDWNGDGRTDIAVFRNGTFVRAVLTAGGSCIPCQLITIAVPFDSVGFGQAGDLPVAGDWDGDGKDDLGVFRPAEQGTFLLRVPQPICPFCVPSRTILTTRTVILGTAGLLPVAGDWDGDGKDEVGLFDPATANFFVSFDLVKLTIAFPFGLPGDRPLAGDWLGAGHDGVGVFHPSVPTMSLSSEIGAPPELVFAFGVPEGLPVSGHWTAVSH
jgi:Tol biopolymer transport system component